MAERAVAIYDYAAYLELEVEKETDTKYEFHDGMITAMAGGSPERGLLAMNMGGELRNVLAERPCSVYNSDVKIRIEASNRTFYPDVSVVCGEAKKSDKDPNALTNPILIVEVLSESTAAFDLGAKFGYYRQLESLRQYLVVSQDEARIDSYYRKEEGSWEIQSFSLLTDSIPLKSIDASLNMLDIYRRLPGIDPAVS